MKKKNSGSKPLAEIKEQVKKIKDSGLLPKGYAKKIQDKLGLDSYEAVYQVAGGHYYNEEIVDAILEIAEENKLKNQIERAKEILKD